MLRMSKAVLVIDIPETCNECLLCPDDGYCRAKIEKGRYKFCTARYTEKAAWCPLRELPEKIQEKAVDKYEFGIIGKGFEQGWNACITTITGG